MAGNYVTAIHRGPDNVMWFGTNGGVSRYDGKEFVRHKMLDAIGTLALTGMRFNQTSFRFNMTGHSFDIPALKDLIARGIFTEYTGPKNRVALRDKRDPNTL